MILNILIMRLNVQKNELEPLECVVYRRKLLQGNPENRSYFLRLDKIFAKPQKTSHVQLL